MKIIMDMKCDNLWGPSVLSTVLLHSQHNVDGTHLLCLHFTSYWLQLLQLSNVTMTSDLLSN
jgi:hypothetical protein